MGSNWVAFCEFILLYRSVGCIFGELLTFSPIFPGENDIDQLGLVIRTLGTPNEKIWPGVKDLPDYSKITFPETPAIPLENLIPDASPSAKELFKRFITYDSAKRIPAREALMQVRHHTLECVASLLIRVVPGLFLRGPFARPPQEHAPSQQGRQQQDLQGNAQGTGEGRQALR